MSKKEKEKANRKKRSGEVTLVHGMIMEMVAAHLQVESSVVQDGLLDSDQHIALLKNLLKRNGSSAVFFSYQLLPPPFESGRESTGDTEFHRVVVSDGSDLVMEGTNVLVFRMNNSATIDHNNMAELMFFNKMEVPQDGNLLAGIKEMLSSVGARPAEATQQWGEMAASDTKLRDTFLTKVSAFENLLTSAGQNVDAIKNMELNDLYVDDSVMERIKDHPDVCQILKEDPNLAADIDKMVKRWYRNIDQIIGSTHAIRDEDETVGPLAELDFWQHSLAILTSLGNFMVSKPARLALNILHGIPPYNEMGDVRALKPHVEKWNDLLARVEAASLEAEDSVKYLSELSDKLQNLYITSPPGLPACLRSILHSLRHMYASSEYFNSTDRANVLPVKITNQVVLAFRSFLTDNGTRMLWSFPKHEVISRIEVCLNVQESYRKSFGEIKESHNDRKGDEALKCTEATVFSRINVFCNRLVKIRDALKRYIELSILRNSSLEGEDVLSKKLDIALRALVSQATLPLDVLDPATDALLEKYSKEVNSVERGVQQLMKDTLAKCPDVHTSINMLKRFESLNLSCLCIDYEFFSLLQVYQKELRLLKRRFDAERKNPPLPLTLPPISGRIAWVRHMYKKCERPMTEFQKLSALLELPLAQSLMKQYTSFVMTMMHYENQMYNAWCQQISSNELLALPVLRREQNRILAVNWSPYLDETVQEAEALIKLGWEMPTKVVTLYCTYHATLRTSYQLKDLVSKYNEFRRSISKLHLPLMRSLLNRLDALIHPGEEEVTWLSASLPDFRLAVEKRLADLRDFKDATSTYRIDEPMKRVAQLNLITLPSLDDPMELKEFVNTNAEYRIQLKRNLNSVITVAESTAIEIVNSFVDEFDVPSVENEKYRWLDPSVLNQPYDYVPDEVSEKLAFQLWTGPSEHDVPRLHRDCMRVYCELFQRVLAALSAAVVKTFSDLRSRLINENKSTPMLGAELQLSKAELVCVPSLRHVDSAVDSLASDIKDLLRSLIVWGCRTVRESVSPRPDDVKPYPYSKRIEGNKDVTRFISEAFGAAAFFENGAKQFMNVYAAFSFLWKTDVKEKVKAFLAGEPDYGKVETEVKKYIRCRKEVDALPDSEDVACLRISAVRVKDMLREAAQKWETVLMTGLIDHYGVKLRMVSSYIADKEKALERTIDDLDDARMLMLCLAEIRSHSVDLSDSIDEISKTFNLLANTLDVGPDLAAEADVIRHNFNKLKAKSVAVQTMLGDSKEQLAKDFIESLHDFIDDEKQFHEEYDKNGPNNPELTSKEASERVLTANVNLDGLLKRWKKIYEAEQLFGMTLSDFPRLTEKKKQLELLTRLYDLWGQVNSAIDKYQEVLWNEIDVEDMANALNDFQNKYKRLPKTLKTYTAYAEIVQRVDHLKDMCPLMELLAHPSLQDRHWKRVAVVTSSDLEYESPQFSLKHVLDAPLVFHKEDVEDICISAQKEQDVELKLNNVKVEWRAVNLTFASFKNRGELLLKGQETHDIISQLEDSVMILSSLFTNRYNVPFKKDIQIWLKKLAKTSETLENWLLVQNLWLYLEAVFLSGDIAKNLSQEASRFSKIDRQWMQLMKQAQSKGNAVEVASDEPTSEMLVHLLEQLELCQKSLTGYLETLRKAFPRFFFVSDPTLLEILGEASDCHTIQNHLLNIFENVYLVEFDEKAPDCIVGMYSREMEHIPLEPVTCSGPVEEWLMRLLNATHAAVNDVIGEIAMLLDEPDFDLMDILERYPAQIGLLAIQFQWTRDAENALKRSRLDHITLKETSHNFLKILNTLIEQTTRDLTKVERTKFETLVTIHVHQRDIFDQMIRRQVQSPRDFEWLKNMRFYWNKNEEETEVKITDVDFIYQNEFMGCTERLVITPLTDRCYITLAQAIGMSMGGAPAGPAGTGKTETTKDMAKALGKYCVVFNCSDQMDFRGLGRIFKGLAQSGSWGCFDEFNRIDLPVLSVAAQQISLVLTARRMKESSFVFSDGDTVPLNSEVGIFITMNPGYAGRQELPENLKMMFRPISMMVPDRKIIMRVKLAACGFKENIPLASKFFTLYQLCEEQLSKQVHYDFGLRNILSVLRTLGAQKRANLKDSEDTTVKNVLRYMNVSKLVDEDEKLFLDLVEDLFPSSKVKGSSHRDLQKAIGDACADMHLVNHPAWNLKMVQLYETSLVRHGLMVLGPTGAGKSTACRTLMRALTLTGLPHKEVRMNPKAITAPQMFGRLDVATNDWTDGIFSTLWRRTLKVPKNENTWLILDGPVDAVWIENLNSVLDDNKTLTLANGDRITMAANCKLVFEPDNVTNASPATISRMGMVFLSPSCMPWSVTLKGWLMTQPSQYGAMLEPLFNGIYSDVHEYVSTKLHPVMPAAGAVYISQCCRILQGLIEPVANKNKVTQKHWERLFLFAIMWSLGALLELADRDLMTAFVRGHSSKLDWPKTKPGESIFEYFVDEVGSWQHWSHRVEEFFYPEDSVPDYLSILVPNLDNVRTVYLIKTIADLGKPVLLIGEPGTAKTVMMKTYLSDLDPEEHIYKMYNFSYATTPNMVQSVIESYVEKRVGSKYGPPGGRKMTVFIDDLSMPVVNEWGDQVTNELLRQLIEVGGFYSLDRPGEFSTIADMQMVGAMIHPGGGRNDIPARLKRQFVILNCTLPSNQSIDKIFAVIAEGYFCSSRFSDEVVGEVAGLVPLTRTVWQAAKATMLPTPAKVHYVFNLRDLSRIWQGMLTVTREGCGTALELLQLWRHECQRVISDRFVTVKERDWFDKKLLESAKNHMGALGGLLGVENRYFADFLRDAPEPQGDEPDDFVIEAPKVYELVPNWETLRGKLKEYQESYNETMRGSKLDLVMFEDAMRHLLIVSRGIRTPRGSLMLVGVGGSGRQSLTKLASYIAGYNTFQIALTRSYNVGNLLEDLKALYITAGQNGRGVSFLFTDNDIKDETFLEYLNNILSAGEVANLFAKEEREEIANNLIPVMKKEYPRRPRTMDQLYSYFLARAQANLHLVLCFSPAGPKFRSRAMKFPGLISGCTINWFQNWPLDALLAVAEHKLMQFPMMCSGDVKHSVVQAMAASHEVANNACIDYFARFRRMTNVTPKSFLSLLDSYKEMYGEKRSKIDESNMRKTAGVDKLNDAALEVDKSKVELAAKQVLLDIEKKKASDVLAEVLVSRAETEESERAQLVEKRKAEEFALGVAEQRMATQKLLANAEPALRRAEESLKTITPSDISSVRKLTNPPYLITMIMDVVLILLKRRLTPVVYDDERKFFMMNWNESLKVLADPRFLNKLLDYPKKKITSEMTDLMRPYIDHPDYTEEKARISCKSVAGLLLWTRAMAEFHKIYSLRVEPNERELNILTKQYRKAQENLEEAQEKLAEKQKVLNVLQKKYDGALHNQKVAEKEAMDCKKKIEKAQRLIDSLKGEKQRWSDDLTKFQGQKERLAGDAAILTVFLCYAGPFNQEFREDLCKKWINLVDGLKIPFTRNMDIIQELTDDATVGEWNVKGLPSDNLSVQNGILVQKAPRYPLLIDPQTQGKNWLINMEKSNQLQVTTLNDRYFRNYLEDCLSLGRPLLIEDVEEELDPVLDHVLEKNYVKLGYSLKVKVGDKEVDIHKDFRLFITTKLANPTFQPEVAARTAIIDFTVTMKGLEEQLLGRVIASEQNDLEVQRLSLIEGVTANRREMVMLDEGLLQKLSSIEGSLLEDDSLVELLNDSKTASVELQVKLENAEKTRERVNSSREEFRPVATRGSILYFLIVDMGQVNCMYRTSLAQFLDRFHFSLKKSEKHVLPAERIKRINEFLTFEMFRYTTRGLYVENKFMFTLLLTLKIELQNGTITNEEFQCLIKGGSALTLHEMTEKPCAWIPDQTWGNLVMLSRIRPFQQILDDVPKAEAKWKAWYNREAPEMELPPEPYKKLDDWKKLLLIRSWCDDRIFGAGRLFIRSCLGPRFTDPIIVNMEAMVRESRPNMPLLCLLSPGADPSPQIIRLARSIPISCHAISMGQGQEVHARTHIDHAMEEGGWVLLQNCHLGLKYMSEVALRITSAEKIHEKFRLFLTTEVHCSFPVALLHISIKYTNEAPQGIRAGLQRTYADFTEDTLEQSDAAEYLPLLFTACFFHTVVQERRKFGPLGWCIPYEFNASDWLASTTFIMQHLESMDKKSTVSWKTLRYMIGEIQYGGRVTDDFDKRLLITLTRHYFSEATLETDYQFYPGYPLLKFKSTAKYASALKKFPDTDSPEVVGLHPNANIAFQTNSMKAILGDIISIQPKQGALVGGTTREERVALLAKDMLLRLPKNYDPHETRLRLVEMETERSGKRDGTLSPMLIFLRQEIDRMRVVLKIIKQSLGDLLLAIEGSIVMNEALNDTMDSMDVARVPAVWLRRSWSSSSLGAWFTELIQRNQQFSSWLNKGRLLNFWMTGFFNPQGFLTAMRQEVARAHKWTLDSVLLSNKVLRITKEEMSKAEPEGVVVYGLFLNGAGWDRRESVMVESPAKVLYVPMPLIHITAVTAGPPKKEVAILYQCPVYKKPVRTDLTYITSLNLITKKQSPEHWIMRGVALLCDDKF